MDTNWALNAVQDMLHGFDVSDKELLERSWYPYIVMIVAVVPVVCLATNLSHERCVRTCARVRAVSAVSTLKRGLGLWVPLGYVLSVEASKRACARAPTSLFSGVTALTTRPLFGC